MTEQEFADVVEKHRPYLVRFARRVIGRTNVRVEAEDVVQSALTHAWLARDGFRQQASPTSWFCAIIKNEVLQEFRRAVNKVAFLELDVLYNVAGNLTPEERLSGVLLYERLAAVLHGLPHKQRRDFLMSVLHDNRITEVCRATGSNISTMKSRVRRVRDYLAPRLAS